MNSNTSGGWSESNYGKSNGGNSQTNASGISGLTPTDLASSINGGEDEDNNDDDGDLSDMEGLNGGKNLVMEALLNLFDSIQMTIYEKGEHALA